MELDDFKLAWQTLDRRLERQEALDLQLIRDNGLDRVRRGLRPLKWGQAVQILIGIAGVLLFAPFWIAHRHEPALLASGFVMYLYSLALIVFGAMIEGHIARIDYAAPVLAIQKRLLRLRRIYAVGGTLFLGLPWWFLYVPLMVVLVAMASGADLVHSAPAFVYAGLGVGALGLLASAGIYRWARRPAHAHWGRRLDDGAAGGSIRRAQAAAAEIARFERD